MPFSANRAHGDRCWRRVRHQPCVHGVGNAGAKKPQLLQQQADVVPGAAHHCMQSVADRTFERVAGEPAVGFHAADGGFDRAAPLDRCVQRSCEPALLA